MIDCLKISLIVILSFSLHLHNFPNRIYEAMLELTGRFDVFDLLK